eukprot:15588-Heterococcus_DN1.PRE.6
MYNYTLAISRSSVTPQFQIQRRNNTVLQDSITIREGIVPNNILVVGAVGMYRFQLESNTANGGAVISKYKYDAKHNDVVNCMSSFTAYTPTTCLITSCRLSPINEVANCCIYCVDVNSFCLLLSGSYVDFELKIGTLTTAIIHVYINGVDVTTIEPAIKTASLVHHIQGLTVQLTDASGMNIIPYDSDTSAYKVVLECPQSEVSRAWSENNQDNDQYMTQQATLMTSQQGLMSQPVFEFQDFWCSVKPPTTKSQKVVEVPLTIAIIGELTNKNGKKVKHNYTQHELLVLASKSSVRVSCIKLTKVDDKITIDLLNEAEVCITDNDDLYSNVRWWLECADYKGQVSVGVTDKQITLQMINAAILPWSNDQYQLICEYIEARDEIKQLLPQSLQTIETRFGELSQYIHPVQPQPPPPLDDDSHDESDDEDIVIPEPAQKQRRKRKAPSGGGSSSVKKSKRTEAPLQHDVQVVSRPQCHHGTFTHIQQAYLNQFVRGAMPIVAQITIADDDLERSVACALGKQTLQTFIIPGTQDDIPNESPPCGITLVSRQRVNETQAPSELSEEALEDSGAQYAYTLVTTVQDGQTALLFNVFGNMLIVGTKQKALQLHDRLHTSSNSDEPYCTPVAIPRIISRDGHGVSSTGHITKLDIEAMTDATTGQRVPPYFASGAVATDTTDGAAAAAVSKGKGHVYQLITAGAAIAYNSPTNVMRHAVVAAAAVAIVAAIVEIVDTIVVAVIAVAVVVSLVASDVVQSNH